MPTWYCRNASPHPPSRDVRSGVSGCPHDRHSGTPGGYGIAGLFRCPPAAPQALRAAADALAAIPDDCPHDVSLHDLASNAAHRRSHHDHRLALVAHSREELAEQLAALRRRDSPHRRARIARHGQRPRLAFVCSGQGPQWWAMGRQLLEQEPVFRATISALR